MTGRRPTERDSVREILGRSHLPALDGMRAIAVGAVVAFHAGAPVSGDLGVSFFFVLSGFLITWLLLREFRHMGDISLRSFYARRALRIFPAYYVFIALSYVIDRLMHDPWPPGLGLSSLVYAVNYFNATHDHPTTAIAHTWSLSVEEQFYLLWPALLVWGLKARRAVPWWVGGMIVAVMSWRSFLYLGHHIGGAWAYNAFDCRFDNLLVGCLLAFVGDREASQPAMRALARWWWTPLVTLALILTSRMATPIGYHNGPGFTIDAILLAVLLLQLLQLSGSSAWRWLEHPVARYLGRISYPIYLYHLLGFSVGRHLPLLPPGAKTAAGVLAGIGLAAGSYHVVELPFLRLKQRFARVRTD